MEGWWLLSTLSMNPYGLYSTSRGLRDSFSTFPAAAFRRRVRVCTTTAEGKSHSHRR